MDLLRYNPKYIPQSCGFINLGATCYFNSLLQCLMSCSSIYETLHNMDSTKRANIPIAKELYDLWTQALSGSDVSQMCQKVWHEIIRVAMRKKDRVMVGFGQQDAHEGLMLFLDAIEPLNEVMNLFKHRYQISIFCNSCNKEISTRKEQGITFDVQPNLKMEQHEIFKDQDQNYNKSMDLNDFLFQHNGFIEGFKCPNCGSTEPKYQTNTLTMIPEILPVLLKKYEEKTKTIFPLSMTFQNKSRTVKFHYDLVAQSEHSGNTNGGHYWAICQRSDGWRVLNDSCISDGQPGPTLESYVLFYHLIKIEIVNY